MKVAKNDQPCQMPLTNPVTMEHIVSRYSDSKMSFAIVSSAVSVLYQMNALLCSLLSSNCSTEKGTIVSLSSSPGLGPSVARFVSHPPPRSCPPHPNPPCYTYFIWILTGCRLKWSVAPHSLTEVCFLSATKAALHLPRFLVSIHLATHCIELVAWSVLYCFSC